MASFIPYNYQCTFTDPVRGLVAAFSYDALSNYNSPHRHGKWAVVDSLGVWTGASGDDRKELKRLQPAGYYVIPSVSVR